MEPNNFELKSKISQALNKLNQSSQVFDDMIDDYNILYKKYMDLQKRPEQKQRLYSMQVKQEEVVKNDPE